MFIALVVVQNVCTEVVLDTERSGTMLHTKSGKRLGFQVMWARIKGEFSHYNGGFGELISFHRQVRGSSMDVVQQAGIYRSA